MWDREQLIAVFKSELKSQGFRKNANTWHLVFDEVIQIVNLQNSSWSKDDHYLNVGLYLRALGDELKPKVALGQIRGRPRQLFDPPISTAVEDALRVNDLRKSSLHEEEVLVTFFREPFKQFSDQYRTAEAIRQGIINGRFKRCGVYGTAMHYFGLVAE